LIPTICDITANTMQHISLNFISGSVYQMTKGGSIATTLLFSILYLKNRPKRSQIIGCCIAVLGIMVVGVSNVLYSNNPKGSGSVIL
jgi:drug/metabolite transporter (DMT)-like permease